MVDPSGKASLVEVAVTTTVLAIIVGTTYYNSQIGFSAVDQISSDSLQSYSAIGGAALISLMVGGDARKFLICSLFSNILCNEDERLKDRPPGFWPGDKGAAEWGRRHGVGAEEGKRRFHKGIKQGDKVSGATDDYSTNPDTGEVIDPAGDYAGNLEDDYE